MYAILLTATLVLCSANAQDVLVTCFNNGSSPAAPDGCSQEGEALSYRVCCTQPGAESIRYNLQGDCRQCGPVLNPGNTYPFNVSPTSVILRWQLEAGSLAPTGGYIANFQEEADEGVPLFSSEPGPNDTSVQFIELQTGLRYVFTVQAVVAGSGGAVQSPSVIREWVVGEDSLPSFSGFTQDETTPTSVRARWVLESNGVGALAQVVVKWRDGASNAPLGEFPTSNVMIITLSEPLADGDAVTTEFSGLTPATIYAVLVQGVNLAGISSTNFAMETASPAATEGLSRAGSAVCSPALLLALLTLTVALLNYQLLAH